MKFYKSLIIVSLIILLKYQLNAIQLEKVQPESVGMSNNRLQSIDTTIKEAISNKKFPGAVIAISRKGKLVYFESFGWQNYSKKIPMKKDSIFRIYSMTKPIVSIATMILHERGKLYLS